MKLFCVGYPRSGTMSLANLFSKAGINSEHIVDVRKGRPIKNETKLTNTLYAYDFSKWAEKKAKTLPAGNYVECDPYNGVAIEELSREVQNSKFVIVLRDPMSCCNSLLHLRWLSNLRRVRSLDIRKYYYQWATYHLYMASKIPHMKEPPCLLMFDDFISGSKTGNLLGLFGIHDHTVTQEKLNSYGSYMKDRPNDHETIVIQLVVNLLKERCILL